MRWLHHPLRADDSRIYIRPALDLLEEVKRTGDIFLPKRWLDALLGGHSAPEAALIVREFLATCPENYPAALRRTVLASADHLFRASSRFTSTRTNSL
jgi:aminopeptidase N